MTEVTLSHGQTVTVHPVPPFAIAHLEARHPIPENLDAAETQAAMQAREQLVNEAAWLIALENVDVPDSWQFPRGLCYAGIQPREGDQGQLLDYIEYGLLQTPQDIRQVQAVMYGDALTETEVEAAEATFPPDGGRETAP